MFQKGDRATFQGKTVEILQADPSGSRFVVRFVDTGVAVPAVAPQLSGYVGDFQSERKTTDQMEVADVGKKAGPYGPSPPDKIAKAIDEWDPMDGFEFHRILREANALNLVDLPELSKEHDASVSTVRNWVEGALRPSRNVQRAILGHIMSNIQSADIRQTLEAQDAAIEAVVDFEPAPHQPASFNLDALKEQALSQENQLIEVRGRSLTVEYTVHKDGTWKAQIREMTSIVAQGESKLEALFDVKAIALDTIEKAIPRKEAK